MAGATVVAVLNSGRCGTGWLADTLADLHPALDTEHEPIGARYAPRRHFRNYDDPTAILRIPEVRRHFERIEGARRPYVETGWPLFAALPLFADRLGDRLRVVHLTRHPVPSALSHLAHRTYAGSERDDSYTRLATLAPDDPNVFQPSYAWTWDQLSPYEKCLFWWTEVNLFGLEFPGEFEHVPVLRLKAEDLLSGNRDALRLLLTFLDLPWDERWLARTVTGIDRWHHHTDGHVDPLEIHRHPTTVEVARELGYETSGLNAGELLARYRGERDRGRRL